MFAEEAKFDSVRGEGDSLFRSIWVIWDDLPPFRMPLPFASSPLLIKYDTQSDGGRKQSIPSLQASRLQNSGRSASMMNRRWKGL